MLDTVIVRSPAVFTVDTKGNRVFSEAEDGFKPLSKVRVSLDGDLWNGKTFTISNVRTARTVDVTSGPEQRYYCIGALVLLH